MSTENPDSEKNPPLDKDNEEELAPNSSVDDFFSRMNRDMRRPKPAQEAVSAALQAIQRLGIQSDTEESLASEEVSTIPDDMCVACGNHNPSGNKFCASCGVPISTRPKMSQAIAAPPKSPELPPGPHHYHHHFHHHYFASEGAPSAGSAPSVISARDSAARGSDRARTPLAGATLSRAESAVRKVQQDWALACNTKHLDDLAELYAADALVLRPNVPPVRGTASIREFLFSVLDAGLGEVELDPLRTEIFGDFAFEAGRCKMLVPSAAGKRREERGKYVVVLTRQAGEWRIIADSWSSDLSMGGGVEPTPAKSADQSLNPMSRSMRKGL